MLLGDFLQTVNLHILVIFQLWLKWSDLTEVSTAAILWNNYLKFTPWSVHIRKLFDDKSNQFSPAGPNFLSSIFEIETDYILIRFRPFFLITHHPKNVTTRIHNNARINDVLLTLHHYNRQINREGVWGIKIEIPLHLCPLYQLGKHFKQIILFCSNQVVISFKYKNKYIIYYL